MKSVAKVCAKVKELTLSIFKPVKSEEIVQRVNMVLDGWGNYFQCGYPSKAFGKVEVVGYLSDAHLGGLQQERGLHQ